MEANVFKFVREELPSTEGWDSTVFTGVPGGPFSLFYKGITCSLSGTQLYKTYTVTGATGGFTSNTVNGAALTPGLHWALLKPDTRYTYEGNSLLLNSVTLNSKDIQEVRLQLGGQLIAVSTIFNADHTVCTLFPSLYAPLPVFCAPKYPPKLYLGYTAIATLPKLLTAKFQLGPKCPKEVSGVSHGLVFMDNMLGYIRFDSPSVKVMRGSVRFPCVCCKQSLQVDDKESLSEASLLHWLNTHAVPMPRICCESPNLQFSAN